MILMKMLLPNESIQVYNQYPPLRRISPTEKNRNENLQKIVKKISITASNDAT